MALKVYTSGNYIITDTGTVMHEFAKGYTTYSYNQSTDIFTIRESVGGFFTVTRAQLLAGDIIDEAESAYTFNSFVTFLRENTGFKTASGGSEAYSTTVVNISSAQILDMGLTPIELLPAAGVGKYYDIDKVILEYTHVTTAYTLGTATRIRVSDSNGMMFFDADSGQLSEVDNNVSRLTPITVFNNAAGAGGSEITQGYFYTNDSLSLSTISDAGSGVDVTLGDGTLRAIITYTTRTFGS